MEEEKKKKSVLFISSVHFTFRIHLFKNQNTYANAQVYIQVYMHVFKHT